MLQRTTYAIALTILTAIPASAQEDKWTWQKAIPAGRTIEIRGIIGDITATPATGNEVEVNATKRGRRSEASSVRIEVVEHSDGVTICALYEEEDDCEGGDGRSHNRENDTRVDFVVRVPRGVLLDARTVIGDIEATGLTADVDANSVTGDVNVATSGLVEAGSVSGSIHVRMNRMDWERLDFRTVSGDITLELPSDLNTDVSFTTVSGNISTDWEITSRGNPTRRKFRGTIGRGGRELSFSTVSGDVELRKIN